MPPKKPFRRGDKKKNGTKIVAAKSAVAERVEKGGTSFADLDNDWVEPDDISLGGFSKASSKGSRTAGKGLYGIYKRATNRFKDGLMAMVPAEIFALDRVQTIMDAVDYIVDHRQKIDPILLEDCRISLHFRKSHSKYFEDGGDEGHEYFILVLGYCLQSLKPLVPQSKQKPAKENEKRFCFADLNIESDGEDEGDNNEDDNPSPPLVRPPEPEDEFTIDDLVESTDRCQACLFLFNVEKCMKVVSLNFARLKKKAHYLRDNDIDDPSCLIGPLMTAAAATNFSIRQVQLMEEELKLNLPHLSTFYLIIACVSLKFQIDELEILSRELGKSVPRFEFTAFVGDLVELSFRLPDEMGECIDRDVRDFARKWSLPYDRIKSIGAGIFIRSLFETRPRAVQAYFEEMPDAPPPHQWLRNVKYTGRDRSILNTQALVQQTAKILLNVRPREMPPIHASEGFFGSLWDEQQCPAQKIQGDLDQLLREQILPELMCNCSVGPLHDEIPRADELLPFVKLLKEYVKNPAKPVPISLTFGVHAILTSIYELQGDDDVATIANVAKNAFNVYFTQLDDLLQHPDFASSGMWPSNVKSLLSYKELATSPEYDERLLARAYWNPCCAGMFLNYLSFHVNVGGGTPFMNSIDQLRMILHLCNAFQLRGVAIQNIPLLTYLVKYFDGAQYIWGGEKPKRENIVKQYLIAYGVKADALRDMHEDCRRFVMEKKPSLFEKLVKARDSRGGSTRKAAGDCRPSDISQAYRKMCLGDFNGMTEPQNGSIPGKDENEWEWYMQYGRFLIDTMATVAHEEKLVSCNLAALGCCLSGFMHFLSERLGWEASLNQLLAKVDTSRIFESEKRRVKGPRRGNSTPDSPASTAVFDAYAHSTVFTKWFVNHILGPLEFLDVVEDDPVVVAARDCLVDFLSSLDPAKYEIFNVLSDYKDCEQEPTNSEKNDDDDSEQMTGADSETGDNTVSETEQHEGDSREDQAVS